MFNILIITHGTLCEELKTSVKFNAEGNDIITSSIIYSINKDTRDNDTLMLQEDIKWS